MFTPNRNSDAESRVKRAIKSFKEEVGMRELTCNEKRLVPGSQRRNRNAFSPSSLLWEYLLDDQRYRNDLSDRGWRTCGWWSDEIFKIGIKTKVEVRILWISVWMTDFHISPIWTPNQRNEHTDRVECNNWPSELKTPVPRTEAMQALKRSPNPLSIRLY